MHGSFFMNYSFKTRANGFYGQLTGCKIYSIDQFEDVERLINDCLKVLKTGSESEVTFEHFDNGSTSLSRIYVTYDGRGKSVVWKKTQYGNTESIREDFTVNKKAVKEFVLKAIELFRDKEAQDAA